MTTDSPIATTLIEKITDWQVSTRNEGHYTRIGIDMACMVIGNIIRQHFAGDMVAELLAAAQELHNDVEDYARINNLGGYDNHSMKRVRAAIAAIYAGGGRAAERQIAPVGVDAPPTPAPITTKEDAPNSNAGVSSNAAFVTSSANNGSVCGFCNQVVCHKSCYHAQPSGIRVDIEAGAIALCEKGGNTGFANSWVEKSEKTKEAYRNSFKEALKAAGVKYVD